MARDQITGVVIRGQSFAWATVRKARSQFETVVSRRETLVPEAVQAEGVTAAAGVGASLRALKLKIEGRVVGSVPTHRVLLRVLDLPAVSDEERAGMVELQVDKFSPFPVESLVVSHEILAESAGSQRVLIAAVQTALVEELGGVLREAGLRADAVDVDVLGWWRLIVDARAVAPDGRTVTVIFDDGRCELIVAEQGVPVTFRTLDGQGGLSDEEYARELEQEVRYTLTSLELERGALALSHITIWHDEGAVPHACVTALKSAFDVPAEPRSLAQLPALAEGLARRHAAAASSVIDLVPTAWRSASDRQRVKKRLIIGSALVLCLWVGAIAAVLGWREWENRKLVALQRTVTALHPSANEVRLVRRRAKSLQQFGTSRIVALDCLREIAAVQPPAVELKSYSYTHESVTLQGTAAQATPVFDFKSSLDKIPLFNSVTLQGPTKSSDGLESFRITLQTREAAP